MYSSLYTQQHIHMYLYDERDTRVISLFLPLRVFHTDVPLCTLSKNLRNDDHQTSNNDKSKSTFAYKRMSASYAFHLTTAAELIDWLLRSHTHTHIRVSQSHLLWCFAIHTKIYFRFVITERKQNVNSNTNKTESTQGKKGRTIIFFFFCLFILSFAFVAHLSHLSRFIWS